MALGATASQPSIPSLPAEFLSFLHANNLPVTTYTSLLTYALTNLPTPTSKPSLPSRFIHPTFHPEHAHPIPLEISQSLNISQEDLTSIPWLPSPELEFYRLPGWVKMASCELYQQGRIQALDAGSAVAVHALSLSLDEHVLDLCCAPGGKLALCAEMVREGRGTVTGVDISLNRLGITKSVLGKLGNGGKTRLFVGDGRAFDVGVERGNLYWRAKEFGLGVEEEKRRDEEEEGVWAGWEREEKRRGENEITTKGFLIPRRLRKGKIDPQVVSKEAFIPYDKVLVDAECTHDGSIAHILKYLEIAPPSPSSPTHQPTFSFPPGLFKSLSTASPSSTLPHLQLSLLMNGFRVLKPNGILVYSTCSLSVHQGEEIVQKFLDIVNKEAGKVRAVVEDVPGREAMPCEERDVGLLEGKGLRFSGKLEVGREKDWLSGLFVCRIRKIC